MNYLAHVVLSKKNIDYQLGNLLADPLKAKAWEGCSQCHLDGIKMHGHIDSFTDSNHHVRQAKAKLGAKGHLRGVVLDVTFDHFLIKHWEKFVSIDFATFINRLYEGRLN